MLKNLSKCKSDLCINSINSVNITIKAHTHTQFKDHENAREITLLFMCKLPPFHPIMGSSCLRHRLSAYLFHLKTVAFGYSSARRWVGTQQAPLPRAPRWGVGRSPLPLAPINAHTGRNSVCGPVAARTGARSLVITWPDESNAKP